MQDDGAYTKKSAQVKILDAASILFDNKGFSSTTVNDIAVTSGETVQEISRLFPDPKIDILRKLLATRRDKDLTKQLIIETVKNDIVKKGYLHVSTNHVARETGKSIAIIYKYFPRGRVDILRAIIANQVNEMFTTSGDLNIGDLDAFLTTMLQSFISMHKKNLAINNALQIAMLGDKTLFQEFNQVFDPVERQLTQFAVHVLQQLHAIPTERFSPQEVEEKVYRILHILESVFLLQLNFGILFSSGQEMLPYFVRLAKQMLALEFGSLNSCL